MARNQPRSMTRGLPRVKAVVFDLDGTLIRSAVDFPKLKRETIDLLARGGLPAERFSAEMKSYEILSLAYELCRERGLTEEKLESMRRRVEAVWNRIEIESVNCAVPVEGVKEVLRELKRRGIKVGVVTRGCRAYALKALAMTNLLEAVDVVVGRDDTAQPKPHPEPLMKALSELGFKTGEALMVGDGVDDALCAREAGVRFAGIRSEALMAKQLDLRCDVLLDAVGDLSPLVC